ncbi:hypothetical protein C8Q79DRAFT_918924 [Trametes meyenii]|nr:hypothetical protein C8Q79DRAFT_918924 [Trametes meyenii]
MHLAIAELRSRRATTAYRWVKGHNGHRGNEEADALAARGASKEQGEEMDLAIPAPLMLSGAKLCCMTQKLAYKAIRERKAEKLRARPATTANLEEAKTDLWEACGRRVTTEGIWRSLYKKGVMRECRQYLWKAIHDAFMVGKHWQREKMPELLQQRALCKTCGELEDMRHILLKCKAHGQGAVWDLLRRTWGLTGKQWVTPSWGLAVAPGCYRVEDQVATGKPTAMEELWTILWSESVYLIWKIRCERVIQNDGRDFTLEEITNRWYATMNQRLALDRGAAAKYLGKRALNPKRVNTVWRPILEGAAALQDDWVLDGGVLVGIRKA